MSENNFNETGNNPNNTNEEFGRKSEYNPNDYNANTYNINKEGSGKILSNYIKVLIVAVTCIIPVLGLITGLIMAIVYMTSVEEDYKLFGRALLILVLVKIGLSILFCAFSFFVGASFFSNMFNTFGGEINHIPYIFYDWYVS